MCARCAAPTTPSSAEEEEDYLGRKKPKRGVLPKHATSIMRSWLFQHIVVSLAGKSPGICADLAQIVFHFLKHFILSNDYNHIWCLIC